MTSHLLTSKSGKFSFTMGCTQPHHITSHIHTHINPHTTTHRHIISQHSTPHHVHTPHYTIPHYCTVPRPQHSTAQHTTYLIPLKTTIHHRTLQHQHYTTSQNSPLRPNSLYTPVRMRAAAGGGFTRLH